MRNAFASYLVTLAERDDRLVLLSGDIGNRLFDPFKAKFPDRFFNCGVAEANMTGVAAGMAMCGLRPLTYSITPFNTSRCLEQIRVDICYHKLPVIVVGVGAGLSYAGLGGTHHSCEDIAFMRALPNMTVICPGDSVEVRLALQAALELSGPVYLRIGKKGEPVVHERDPDFEIGKGIIIVQGRQVCLLNTGNTLKVAIDAASLLDRKGVSTQVISMHTVKPLDHRLLNKIFKEFQIVATIEEHSRIGGFGAGVAEWLADNNDSKAVLLRMGTPDAFIHRSGNQTQARQVAGLNANRVAENILDTIHG